MALVPTWWGAHVPSVICKKVGGTNTRMGEVSVDNMTVMLVRRLRCGYDDCEVGMVVPMWAGRCARTRLARRTCSVGDMWHDEGTKQTRWLWRVQSVRVTWLCWKQSNATKNNKGFKLWVRWLPFIIYEDVCERSTLACAAHCPTSNITRLGMVLFAVAVSEWSTCERIMLCIFWWQTWYRWRPGRQLTVHRRARPHLSSLETALMFLRTPYLEVALHCTTFAVGKRLLPGSNSHC